MWNEFETWHQHVSCIPMAQRNICYWNLNHHNNNCIYKAAAKTKHSQCTLNRPWYHLISRHYSWLHNNKEANNSMLIIVDPALAMFSLQTEWSAPLLCIVHEWFKSRGNGNPDQNNAILVGQLQDMVSDLKYITTSDPHKNRELALLLIVNESWNKPFSSPLAVSLEQHYSGKTATAKWCLHDPCIWIHSTRDTVLL